MPLQATSGAASYDAFGGGAAVAPKYIEDFFQTWLRTGTGSSATVTTGLNASINKSLVWTKSRSAATNHKLTDTVRGATKALSSNTTSAEATDSQGLTAFGSTGYTIGTNTVYNNSGATYVDWQWLATPKFFDIVTYTGNGTDGRSIPHNLGSTPGSIIVKCTNTNATDWFVWHRSIANNGLLLNSTSAAQSYYWSPTDTPTSTNILVSGSYGTNVNGETYVAYLFAHNAGGFGLTGTDNVISCGSFNPTSNGSVDLGYEPQWIIAKKATGTGGAWFMWDSMRGWPAGRTVSGQVLRANGDNAEAETNGIAPTATGFDYAALGDTWIYIAIRRGPMKVPTTGTSVYFGGSIPAASTTTWTAPILTDMVIPLLRSGEPYNYYLSDRLRGPVYLQTSSTAAEVAASIAFDVQTGARTTGSWYTDGNFAWFFRRAPGFFDEVCYTGTGANRTVAHNLAAVPELIIVKGRSGATAWQVYSSALANTEYLVLDTTAAKATGANRWNSTTPTSTVFSLGTASEVNTSAATYVAYLFASCPGVSSVGSYTGTGATQVINCGFTGGARFVLIKATSTTRSWYVWDSARGIVAGNDPYLLLNSTAAEVTNTDWVDTAATGFELSNAGGNLANSNGVSYIFLAIS
jgi:hypothetical protein